MKERIRPRYYENIEITCACGFKLITGSMMPGPITVEICSHCHPFWTGEKRLIDTEGRVEQFERHTSYAQQHQGTRLAKKARKEEDQKRKADKPRIMSLKEILAENRK